MFLLGLEGPNNEPEPETLTTLRKGSFPGKSV